MSTIMLTTSKYISPLTSNVQSLCQRFIKTHVSKADKIKKLMKEYKSMFGELVETNKEKKKRLKLEKRGKIPQEKSNKTDAELSWVMKHSGNNLKRIINSSTKPQDELVDSHKFNDGKIISPNDQNIQNSFHFKSNPVLQKVEFKVPNPSYNSSTITTNINNNHNENIPNLSSTENAVAKYDVLSNFERLPNIIIKNLPSFPIMGNKQTSLMQLTEVLSISEQYDAETIKFPSVTKILSQTKSPESKLALEAWKERMIKKLGLKEFEMYQKALLEDGASLHSCIMQSLLGKEYEIPLRIKPVFKSVQHVLKDVHHVKAVETHVAHDKLRYKGVVDCVASYRGENYVIDWKKSDRKKLNLTATYDAPVQVAAYIGAINASNLYPFVIKHGLLVIAYTCGEPATVHEVRDNTLQQYWITWLRRLQQYYFERTSNDDNKSSQ